MKNSPGPHFGVAGVAGAGAGAAAGAGAGVGAGAFGASAFGASALGVSAFGASAFAGAAAGAGVGVTVTAGAAGALVLAGAGAAAGAAGAGAVSAGASPKSFLLEPPCSRAVRIASVKVSPKSTTARRTVNFCSTFVVCAPHTWLVMESPNEAPRPSCRGRCMRTIRIRRRQTMTSTTVRMPINIRVGGKGRRIWGRFLAWQAAFRGPRSPFWHGFGPLQTSGSLQRAPSHTPVASTSVPICSPVRARRMLSGSFMLKTPIGMLFSMQSEKAVASITLS